MNAPEADKLGGAVADLLRRGRLEAAYALLEPVLGQRTRFSMLGRIGALATKAVPHPTATSFLERVAAKKTMGGWVIIGSVLTKRLDQDVGEALALCRTHAVKADVWYGADILGERVPGPALVADLPLGLSLVKPWRTDKNRWVRRTVGVGMHVWAKRSRGRPEHRRGAEKILAFLEPMFSERELAAVKGVGWGIKTLGKHYPDLVADWLQQQLTQGTRCRSVMLRKSLTYLSDDQRARAMRGARAQ